MQSLTEAIELLKTQAQQAFSQAANTRDLYELKVQYFGKNGSFSGLMREMSKLTKDERPAFGQRVNEARLQLESTYDQRERELKAAEMNEQLAKEFVDMTLPGPARTQGAMHPVAQTIAEITAILARLGYSVRIGPLIERDRYNFEALNFPPDHPARDMQDTFFIDKDHVLRTHTSPIQVHAMENEKPPLRILGVGGVFRVDSDISHLPNFHQIEGLLIDRQASMAHLRGTIAFFVREYFGADLKTRFRPSYFPFTEPSAEVDCQCPMCKGKGCNLCKQSGWLEIGGSGLVNPNVIRMAGLEYPKWQGFAWGFGIERMAMIKYSIGDIRLFPENDLRFLGHFPT